MEYAAIVACVLAPIKKRHLEIYPFNCIQLQSSIIITLSLSLNSLYNFFKIVLSSLLSHTTCGINATAQSVVSKMFCIKFLKLEYTIPFFFSLFSTKGLTLIPIVFLSIKPFGNVTCSTGNINAESGVNPIFFNPAFFSNSYVRDSLAEI